MNPAFPVQRNRFQGVAEIFTFNWHWYAIGFAVLAGTTAVFSVFDWPAWMRLSALVGVSAAVCWGVASLAVSHWVYDRSPLRDWQWIANALFLPPRRWMNIHCGLDESSASLRRLFPESIGAIFDIFDPEEMTELSIRRARAMHCGEPATAADFRHLPVALGSVDAAFLLFAAHELRVAASRDELFAEIYRALRKDGELIVVEHLRDFPNFAAFGPGAFHFFSHAEWLRVFAKADFQVRREFDITPFVRVFVLRRIL